MALHEYQGLAADYPRTHNDQFAFGRFLVANHMDDRAVEAFEGELENSPHHLLARLGFALSRAYTAIGREQDAAEARAMFTRLYKKAEAAEQPAPDTRAP